MLKKWLTYGGIAMTAAQPNPAACSASCAASWPDGAATPATTGTAPAAASMTVRRAVRRSSSLSVKNSLTTAG